MKDCSADLHCKEKYMIVLKHKELSEKIIAAAYDVHKELGYGFVEKIYRNALVVSLGEAGIKCISESPLKVKYHNIVIGDYYADIIVDEKIVVEVKAVSKLESIHEVQLVNYLKATGIEVGLLINFGQSVEIKRRIFN